MLTPDQSAWVATVGDLFLCLGPRDEALKHWPALAQVRDRLVPAESWRQAPYALENLAPGLLKVDPDGVVVGYAAF